MKLIPKICIILIAFSLGLFFSTYYHYQGLLGSEVKLASVVAEMTSTFTSSLVYDEPSFVAGGWGITEERSVIFMFALAGLLSFFSGIIAVEARLKNGAYQSFVPIVLCSICVIGSIVYTAYWCGLNAYA